jgi:hypothetical protein
MLLSFEKGGIGFGLEEGETEFLLVTLGGSTTILLGIKHELL